MIDATEELKRLLEKIPNGPALVELSVEEKGLPLVHKAILDCQQIFEEKKCFPVLRLRNDSTVDIKTFSRIILAFSIALDYLGDGDESAANMWCRVIMQDAKTAIANSSLEVLLEAVKENFPFLFPPNNGEENEN